MAMESMLGKLEERIDELVTAHIAARARIVELEAQLATLSETSAAATVADQRIAELEEQRDSMAQRLEKVLEHIDRTLEGASDED